MQAKKSDSNSLTSTLRDPGCDFAQPKFMLIFFCFLARVMFFIKNALVDVRSCGFTMLERFAGSFLPDMQVLKKLI